MLNLALSSIKSTIEAIEIGSVALIERYGGLVFPITIQQEIGKTDGNQPIFKDKVFPVACGVTFQECVTKQRYQELVPNSRYKSIAYWEQLGDATINSALSSKTHKNGLVVYEFSARLIVWLNIAMLNVNGDGQTDCSIVAPIALKLQSALNRKNGFAVVGDAYQGAKAQFIFNGQERKDANSIFGRYTYGKDLSSFMLYPYDFFSLKYTVRLWINQNCVTAFTLGTPIDCPVIPASAS